MTLHAHQKTRVSATRVADRLRMHMLPTVFGSAGIRVEQSAFSWMHELSDTYYGGYWDYFETSNGGFFMAIQDEGAKIPIASPNGYRGEVSAEVSGVIVCLFTYSHLSFQGLPRVSDQFHYLREYALDHPEAAAIFAAID